MRISGHFKIFLCLLLFPLLCLGQAKYPSGKVTYGVDISIDRLEEVKSPNKIAQQYLRNSLKEVQQTATGITSILEFNSKTAHFFTEGGLENDAGSNYKMALLHLDLDGPYYVDLTNKEILQKREAFGKDYLVEEAFENKTNWKISSESKQIDTYKVYKATTVEVVVNNKGRFESEVVAWFTPEIPFSFGPVGFAGLPGLILELEVKSKFPVRYFAKTVDFGTEEITIEVPSKTERITAKELDEMYRKARGNMREFYSGNTGNQS